MDAQHARKQALAGLSVALVTVTRRPVAATGDAILPWTSQGSDIH